MHIGKRSSIRPWQPKQDTTCSTLPVLCVEDPTRAVHPEVRFCNSNVQAHTEGQILPPLQGIPERRGSSTSPGAWNIPTKWKTRLLTCEILRHVWMQHLTKDDSPINQIGESCRSHRLLMPRRLFHPSKESSTGGWQGSIPAHQPTHWSSGRMDGSPPNILKGADRQKDSPGISQTSPTLILRPRNKGRRAGNTTQMIHFWYSISRQQRRKASPKLPSYNWHERRTRCCGYTGYD